jgi:hypothetical protein
MPITKGQWKYEKRGEDSVKSGIESQVSQEDFPYVVNIPCPPFVLGATGALVAKTDGLYSSPDESEANARAISAIPELVEAAQDALASLMRLDDKDGAYRVTNITQLTNALKKAGVL